jgi:hypothetical protein
MDRESRIPRIRMKKFILPLLFLSSVSFAALRTDDIIITNLPPLECVQTDANGKLVTTGAPCGEGEGSSSVFTASFSNGNSTTIEIGAAGVWKAVGALSFEAAYTNGTPIGSTITFTGWASPLPLTNSWLGPTLNTEAVNYPAVAGTVSFLLSAQSATESDTASLTHTFVNRRFWGTSSEASGYTESDVEALSNELSNSKAKTFSVTAETGEYILWASPVRLGTVTFFAGGFEGGFGSPATVSITNASGYTENFYVYRSAHPGLGTVNLVTQ